VELFAPCYGGSFDEILAILRASQDALGEMHDAQVFIGALDDAHRLQAAARAGLGPEDMDGIRAALARRGEAAYARFTDVRVSHPLNDLRTALLAPLAGSSA